jgi:myo-inositol-1(or 4)-monophosphatase
MIHPELIAAVQEAGAVLRQFYSERSTLVIQIKNGESGAASYVTQADTLAEKIIFTALQRLYPHDAIKGEEGSNQKGVTGSMWHIDPLDGTSNFARGIPLFGVQVGRATHGVPDIGIIYFPLTDELFLAEKGKGATCNGEPLHVSTRPLTDALYWCEGYGSGKFHFNEQLMHSVRLSKMISCSSFALALIARGDAEIYCLRNEPHDVVPGVVLITEAGGRVTDASGAPYTTAAATILATNGDVHDAVLGLLRSGNR